MGFDTDISRRRFVGAAAALGGAAIAPQLRAQAAWPNKPIRFVLGYPPGGGSDVMARVVSQPLGEALGQSIIVDNKPGASGNIATAEVARAAPDGYTFLVGPTTQLTANPFLYKLGFNPAADLTAVAALGRFQLHLVTRPGFPAKNVKELIEYARANPGKLTYASAGAGTPPHLVAEIFLRQAGIKAVQVPYRGSGPALQAILAGETDFTIDPGIAFPHVKAGKIQMLGVASAKRPTNFPDVPTLIEAGVPGMEFDTWIGVWAPTGTPANVKAALANALAKVLAVPAVNEKFGALSGEAIYLDAAGYQNVIDRETKVFSGLIKELNIKFD
ncbi:MAG: tripartite tricarboxylate transporter receptor family protein [Ramlibacter sp.]|nr:tripartite tricarboxylate transporter receptor family protein [Ramlibacter sp.]